MTDLGTRTAHNAERPSRMRTLAIVMAAGSLFAAIAIGKLIELVLKAVNPDDVDVSNGLAYLRPLLITAWAIGIVLFVATIVVIVTVHRREGAAAARPAWTVFIVQVVLVVIILALEAALRTVTGAG